MSTQRLAIVDYGMGNIHSVHKALERVSENTDVIITDDPQQILSADRVMFPGVGAIRDCIAGLKSRGLDEALLEFVKTGKPLLAICIGLQALMRHSDENGGVECLGVFPGDVHGFSQRFADAGLYHELKVPHMGWSCVEQMQAHPLWEGIPQNARFYFVHSFFAELDEDSALAGETVYGIPFVASVTKGNVFATQFHPEKSQRWGLQLLSNFSKWNV
ncbi:MAG: imidazole glycerol phosphate synthase subunit HisH [Gammaproteobacteria bacterium]|nr:imidazole glycerol phosphate synthase subunit HisH [Gammaproteobacteria bacterium]